MNNSDLDSIAIIQEPWALEEDFVVLEDSSIANKLEKYINDVKYMLVDKDSVKTTLLYLITKISELIVQKSLPKTPNFGQIKEEIAIKLNSYEQNEPFDIAQFELLANELRDLQKETNIINGIMKNLSETIKMFAEKINSTSDLTNDQVISIRSRSPASLLSMEPTIDGSLQPVIIHRDAKQVKNELKNVSEHLMELNRKFKDLIEDFDKMNIIKEEPERMPQIHSDYKCPKCNCEISKDVITPEEYNNHVKDCQEGVTNTCIFCFKLFTQYNQFYEHIHTHLD